MKEIYILLSKTGTIPSRLIHTIQRGEYTHASFSLTPTTDRFYSFARRSLHNFLNAGFFVEDIHTHVFAKYPDCDCGLYSLEISDEAYERLSKIVTMMIENEDRFDYNFFGLLPAKLGIKMYRKYHYTCSQFVATALYRSGDVKLPKDPSLMMPNDFLLIDGIKEIYSGKIKDCKFPVHKSVAYETLSV